MVMSFIDAHREELGIEPICRELAIAPSSYHEHAVRLAGYPLILAPESSLGGARAKASVLDQTTGISLEGFPGAILG